MSDILAGIIVGMVIGGVGCMTLIKISESKLVPPESYALQSCTADGVTCTRLLLLNNEEQCVGAKIVYAQRPGKWDEVLKCVKEEPVK